MCTVASAPGAASVRVWQIISRGWGPRGGRAVPEGANVAYAHGELDELYDLDRDPYEPTNLAGQPDYRPVRQKLQRDLRRLATKALGL